MSVERFQDDDRSYRAWVASHDQGYVLNIQRSLATSDVRLHQATCGTITGTPTRGSSWTGAYIKLCSDSLRELDDWARANVGAPIRRCGTCQP